MFDDGSRCSVTDVVAWFGAVVDELIGLDRAALSRDELLELVRGCERQLRRLPVADHATLAELNGRGVAAEVGCRDTTNLLRNMLRLSPGEARARVWAAQQIGSRPQLSGAVLPPLFPAVAAAQADGSISTAHARVIIAAVDALPEAVADEHGDAVETALVAHAGALDPTRLQTVARRVIDTLDPDGTLAEDRDHQRRRMLALRPNRDGTGELTGHLTPACLAVWQTVLDSLSAPTPAEDGEPDTRTPGQRAHDGLLDAGQRLLRDGGLPDAGGIPATVIITMTAAQWQTAHDHPTAENDGHATTGHGAGGSAATGVTGTSGGYATTGHGGLISIPEAVRLAGEGQLMPVLLAPTGGIVSYGRSRRCASPGQRLALAARDGGCSFPSCDVPASWCQAHHVVEWVDGGPTDVDNLTLTCGFHHREFAKRGWTVQMINATPHWTPPRWLDPDQIPRRNTTHHPTAA